MPVSFEQQWAGAIPLLLAFPERAAFRLPVVLWFHGFSADKEANRPELQRLAEANFLAVGVDAVEHGERRPPDFDRYLSAPPEETFRMVLDFAGRTAAEVPEIVQSLLSLNMVNPSQIAVAGVSMGGCVVYRAIAIEPAIKAAVALLGYPQWTNEQSAGNDLEAFERVALLSITAENDQTVPPGPARDLHRVLASRRPDSARSRHIEVAGAQHFMEPWQWSVAMDETIRWLKLHINHPSSEP